MGWPCGMAALDVSKEQLEYLLAMGFSGLVISNAIGPIRGISMIVSQEFDDVPGTYTYIL